MAEQIQKRQIAQIVRIADLLEGTFTTQEGWNPSYVLTKWGGQIARVHLAGTVVDRQGQTLRLDDGSASIELRSFDEVPHMDTLKVGDHVRVIGRPRIFNDTLYVNPEIIVPIDAKWILLHQALVQHFRGHHKEPQEQTEPSKKEDEENPDAQILQMIDDMDKGDGVSVADISERLTDEHPDPQKIIDRLLLHGEIFEIKPGRVKVLT